MGTTVFKNNEFTGCSSYKSCTTNTYTLDTRTAKARMITVQKAVVLGCRTKKNSCPIWMSNYLYKSTDYGGTANDTNGTYWTMSAASDNYAYAYAIADTGAIDTGIPYYATGGARAVVVINK